MWLDLEGGEALKPILLGSHHDAVPYGGKYDGALGVLMATEIMETLIEQGIQLRHSMALVSFTGEEPNPFGISTLGSKALAGRITRQEVLASCHRDTQEPLEKAIKNLGGDIERWDELAKETDMGAFIECHIEQGNRLEKLNLPIAAVSMITGIYREKITITGEANHAGTTMMDSRKDALLGACEVALALEKILVKKNDSDLVGTVGYIKNFPNEANIISNETQLMMDVRVSDELKKLELCHEIEEQVKEIEKLRGVKVDRKIILDQPPQKMSKKVIEAIIIGIEAVGYQPVQMISMAGHDAANLGTMTKSGMIFVKSIAGKSHCKEEYSRPEDIEACANAMLQAVLILDKEMD